MTANAVVMARVAIGLVLLGSAAVPAQSRLTDHTVQLDEKEERPPATLTDVGWMVGSWTGEAFGGEFEEVWNAPSANSMVGMFKLMDDNEVEFYELMLIVEEEDSLSLKVKHFTADFSAWEDRDEYVTFRLAEVTENEIHFSGLSFYRRDNDTVDAFIAMRDDGGDVREEKLIFNRNNR